MLAMIELTWDSHAKIKALPRADYERLRKGIPQFNMDEWTEGKNEQPSFYLHGRYLVDLSDDGPMLASLGLAFEVKNFKNTYRAQSTTPGGDVHNLHVHIPNVGLLAIDEVQLLDDACTDRLQSQLDDGWRIVAVCPPNSQRRPDYILGRTKSEAH